MSGLLMAIAGALHPMSSSPKPPVQIILTSGTSWTVPSDWNNSDNKVECIGAGGARTQWGGGGGAYAKKNNLGLTPSGSVTYHIGVPSTTTQATTDTWFVSNSTVRAAGATGSVGGLVSASIGDVVFAGGTNSGAQFSGGAGAGGPSGAGIDNNSPHGSAGDAGFGGAGGVAAPGHDGAEWGTAGSGGGGSGNSSTEGFSGGRFGGGAGGGKTGAGVAASGVIVITYTPA